MWCKIVSNKGFSQWVWSSVAIIHLQTILTKYEKPIVFWFQMGSIVNIIFQTLYTEKQMNLKWHLQSSNSVWTFFYQLSIFWILLYVLFNILAHYMEFVLTYISQRSEWIWNGICKVPALYELFFDQLSIFWILLYVLFNILALFLYVMKTNHFSLRKTSPCAN